MQLELFFDEFETGLDVNIMYVSILERMATPDNSKKRPHLVEVAWGVVFKKPFRCVIASLSVKYTMFTPLGVPVRATVNVKLTEASNPVFKAAQP